MTDEFAGEIESENWYSEETATFGDRLAGAREATGMDRKGLAKRMGVKLKTICHWEEDLSEPRANKLQMLAGVLNVSLVWLLTGQGEGVAAPNEEQAISPDIQSALSELRALKAEFVRSADKLGRLEKALRLHFKDRGL
ncbi:MAG: helix-turn-helix transcriptional regulator [Rhodobacteraceae bacterium]|nr:helix-turn-helix transcriptional regulator [Paracoccaceae bacterium]